MSMSPKAALLEEYALVARALSAPARLMLLEQLAQGPRGVEALADRTGLSIANASQHLQQLRRAGLVASQRDGKAVIYRLADPRALDLMGVVHDLAARNLAQVDQILRGLAGDGVLPDPVSRAALALRLQDGTVTLFDMRPPDEYATAHIPGARNMTLAGLAALESAPGQDIVAYCRGPYCIYAHQAVALLRARGWDARPMAGGLPEWRAEGRAVLSLTP